MKLSKGASCTGMRSKTEPQALRDMEDQEKEMEKEREHPECAESRVQKVFLGGGTEHLCVCVYTGHIYANIHTETHSLQIDTYKLFQINGIL